MAVVPAQGQTEILQLAENSLGSKWIKIENVFLGHKINTSEFLVGKEIRLLKQIVNQYLNLTYNFKLMSNSPD